MKLLFLFLSTFTLSLCFMLLAAESHDAEGIIAMFVCALVSMYGVFNSFKADVHDRRIEKHLPTA